ncbi:synaptonemal complex protein ZEP1 isoform X1 [Amborella trichopoda]|uniref:Synaptonemal complex protein 1 n=1 Tax=Amborella trichopoda TaxID=13333 RepID=U5CXF4_AMBTC|nr:synaptonemal complex protein ZEP1 isoform X1 [Amborella trichopoda]XP_020528235.1 synaptonemal complex protein ZEP1 isoform X1 [Amborella trichopoda]ERN14620.1 hypothetical protein AMTR_s00038p00178460 [Amborella trichopoda]|eukprot:XP_020528234.1 synaptonemal complex protein ZEP1 isoform X1 [Amborella trichopoda]
MMQKLNSSGLRSLDQFTSLPGTSRFFNNPSRSSHEVASVGSFANLKLTAEKLVHDQACAKTDLEFANSKLKKFAEQIHALEAKLQDASNENAKLKVKQKEDSKLWNGLDSKLSSTKTLCDQLTETLQHLAGLVRGAEEDKKFFEDKLLENSKAFDGLHFQLKDFSLKLDSAEERIRHGKHELDTLKREKEEMERSYIDELQSKGMLVIDKDAAIKQLEATVTEDKISLQSLGCQLQDTQKELSMKDDACNSLKATNGTLEEDKINLQFKFQDCERRLLESSIELKNFKNEANSLAKKIAELDKVSRTTSDYVIQLSSSWDTCYSMVQQEKSLTAKCAQLKFDKLHAQFVDVTLANGVLRSEVEGLKNQITELQKSKRALVLQHDEANKLAEEKMQRSQLVIESLTSEKIGLEVSITNLEAKGASLAETLGEIDKQKQDLVLKMSQLESQNLDIKEKAESMLHEKMEEIETLQKEITESGTQVKSLEDQIRNLLQALDEKDQLHLQFLEREKHLEDQRLEMQASLAAAECSLTDAKKQYDLMLEGRQLELIKHLKEISQRNDQEINDIRRKYEMEKQEILNMEKEKAAKLLEEMERTCEKRIAENKEEVQHNLQTFQEEHNSLIKQIQQEYNNKELALKAQKSDEIKRLQIHSENELREKTMLLRKENESQIKALRHQHMDELKTLQEELELQKSKEEKQRALLQLQWKVMDDNQQHEGLEVNSKKEYSVSSIKKKDSGGSKGHHLDTTRHNNEGEVVNFMGSMRTPVLSLSQKVEKGKGENIRNIPKHRKVTRHEYEVETTNGRTITKRKKTKSTVMFADPSTHKKMKMRTPNTEKHSMTLRKGIKDDHPISSPIGDLFKEGSLDPYADDPYAFD